MELRAYLDTLPRGGQAGLARAIGTTPVYLYQISTGRRPVPGNLCLKIQEASAGAVSVHDLRPDIFGPAPFTTSAAHDLDAEASSKAA